MIELIPAYGRKYNTFEEALADWEGGLDFRLYTGSYCSIRDVKLLLKEFGSIKLHGKIILREIV